VNLKGGSSKTTSAAFIAHVLAGLGRAPLLVDADPQASALRWAELAGWELPTVGLPVRDLHRRLPGIVGDRYSDVVIDTPPLEDQGGIVYAALRAAGIVVVTMAPTTMELDRLPPVWAAVDELDAMRDVPPAVAVLLTRTVPRAASTDLVRAAVAGDGRRVLAAGIPRREVYAQAFGAPVDPGDGPYGAAVAEILTTETVETA
jgi:chromosome partitioning protein